MDQSPQAKKLWEAIPQNKRVKLLNNVWCVACSKITEIGNAAMTVESAHLIITGICNACGGKVARLVDADSSSSKPNNATKPKIKPDAHNPDISKLAHFLEGSKTATLISEIGKLKIKSYGNWNPNDLFEDADSGKPTHPYDKILALGQRPCWEMENILPDQDPDDFECPIGVGIDIMEAGDWGKAVRHMKSLLNKDARCLDAYAHLGNWYFEQNEPDDLNTAKNYYKTGVAIGLKSIGRKTNDVFPWGLIDNRPFFRCLHGLGLCFYRASKTTEALMIFSKMIWLNPSDNQGARFLIQALVDGISWENFNAREDASEVH